MEICQLPSIVKPYEKETTGFALSFFVALNLRSSSFLPLLSLQVGSPMPGAVDKVLVAAGTRVEADTPLCVVVAMKMEVMVKAPMGGVVEEVCVEEGGKVVEGALLMRIV